MLTLDGLHVRLGDAGTVGQDPPYLRQAGKVDPDPPGFDLRADLTVGTGQAVAMIGPSGSGKSTLLAAIAGFLRPLAGQVLWQGVDITGLAPGRRPVSILFQDNNLFPHLTIGQNVGLALRPALRLSREEIGQVDAILARVGLADLSDRKPGALSGGQQSRAALARVLLADRPLVLLDEPFAALGPALRDEMLDLATTMIRDSGRTLLMVTHAPEEAARRADSVIVVAERRAMAPVPTADLLRNPPEALRAYLGRQVET